MKLESGHLSYCTNIHSGESWKDHFEAIKNNFPGIKKQVSPDLAMGIGLRLSNSASTELLHPDEIQGFKTWLNDNDAYVFTMNGFPYGDFHHAIVKDQVHAPDWTSEARLEYTVRLFKILAELLPEGMEGGISTSPLSYRHWFPTKELSEEAKKTATKNIILVAEELFRLKISSGIRMHLDIEPEPDGMLETGAEFIAWYENMLIPMAKLILTDSLKISDLEAEECIKEHICLCYDVCHFAIGYEQHSEILEQLDKKGIRIGKIQISAALKADMPEDANSRVSIAEAFSKYNESTYLHQVVARNIDSSLIRYRDLPEALNDSLNPMVKEWRAHFHVPVFAEDLGLLRSTQLDIVEILNIQKSKLFTDHLEVETYTWEVLPDSLKMPIDQSIIRELKWVKDILE
ncbi:metabolite traffic protein EboE [Daejeonella sp.]|jgi:sugar phosphate isomerase/epimerase|uniref:metabolite traffic protein EboE n=1 Tax=Daejeonella sp. TaxID=2805397 RepID=UPI003783A61D